MKQLPTSGNHSRKDSELILNADGTVYHLGINGDHIADTIIIVGDPDRVSNISGRFDRIQVQKANREFAIHTGTLNGKRLSVVSTGIGVDNVDIVINELHVAANFDLPSRAPKGEFRQLSFVRLGTSGCMQADIDVGSFVSSAFALGNDGVPWYYGAELTDQEKQLSETFHSNVEWPAELSKPYVGTADEELLALFDFAQQGITFTSNGFYAPQLRELVVQPRFPHLLEQMQKTRFKGLRFTNFEMECAGIYALSNMFGHRAVTVCAILANRAKGTFTNDAGRVVNDLITNALSRLTR